MDGLLAEWWEVSPGEYALEISVTWKKPKICYTYQKRTEYVAVIVLFPPLLANVARDAQEYQDVVFRGVVIRIKSTDCEETPAPV